MPNNMIEYILDKHICLLDADKKNFCLYKHDIDIIKNFEGFKILNDGTYQYKGHNIVILDEEEDNEVIDKINQVGLINPIFKEELYCKNCNQRYEGSLCYTCPHKRSSWGVLIK